MEEKQTYYLDANILVYASIENEKVGKAARRLLQQIQAGTLQGVTSCLAFDEAFWVLKKAIPDDITTAGQQLLDLPLKFLPIDKQLLHSMITIIEQHDLQPHDALHLAIMQRYNIKTIITEDKDFDNIPNIERRSVLSFPLS